MSPLRSAITITWDGRAISPGARLRSVTWRAMIIPGGSSVDVLVTIRPHTPEGGGLGELMTVRYREDQTPRWIPRPPDGWLGSAGALNDPWKHSKSEELLVASLAEEEEE